MRNLTLLITGLIILCVDSLTAAPIFPATQCDAMPGAFVVSPTIILFLNQSWTAAGFQCQQGDELFSDFTSSGPVPTDVAMVLTLQGTAPNNVNTVNFAGNLSTAFTIGFTVTLDPTSGKSIVQTAADLSNPTHGGNPSVTETVTELLPGVFTGSTTASFLGGPGNAISVVPPARSLLVSDVYTPNGGAATEFGSSFLASQPSSCAPPVVSGISATPNSLWPPNHKLTNVTVNYSVASACPATCTLGVASNEGSVASESQVIDAHHVLLEADRNGNGSGRIYTITASCTNAGGVSSSVSTTVTVPH